MARPRQFDEQEVLEVASNAFWAHGYEATSTRDLTRLMGITPASLYNTFGDKQRLFQLSLEHYLDRTVRANIARLESSLTPALAVTTFFAEMIDRSLGDPAQRGCMLVNCALETTPDAPELKQAVANEFIRLEQFFVRCLKAAELAGEIPRGQSIPDAARQLLAVHLGLRLLARVRPEQALHRGAVEQTLASLGLPQLPKAKRTK
jgi:TetR/AcrR family transcriptional repressor of nem operon